MEKEALVRKILPYIRWCFLTICMIIALFIYEKPFEQEGAKEIIGAISDCISVPGALVSCIATLSYFAKLGAYDGLTYTFSNFSLHSIIPGHHKDKHKTLYEYKQEKDEKGRKWLPQALQVGLVTLGIGVILLIVYALL